MGLVIEDAKKEIDVPRAKKIIIDGREVGNAEPKLYSDRLTWHACIRLDTKGAYISLVQGHGPSVRQAIADGIIQARTYRDEFTKKLAELEGSLGTMDKSAEELMTSVH